MRPKILVTGGAGYVGSHVCVELLQEGYDVVVADNFCNSKPAALERVRQIAGRDLRWLELDLRDHLGLEKLFQQHAFLGVLHCAGVKSVDEGERNPLKYYQHNTEATLTLLDVMQRHHVHRLVYSSSATVYGESTRSPYREEATLAPNNVYGRSKAMAEEALRDLAHADPRWHIAVLRYFNPVGAHSSGLIGEDPNGVPNNLMPHICQVAVGRLDRLSIYGNDYNTPDGTGVRDYLHVVDLAQGHVKALQHLAELPGLAVFNLGAGRGYSVLEMVRAFEHATGIRIPYAIAARRAGDLGSYYADVGRAASVLDWRAERSLEQMCADAWRWQSQNPDGYC